MKKRQQDFQKTKLKVGRKLQKGRNVTNTSFKSKKIITRDQIKPKPDETSLKELLDRLKTSSSVPKKETLSRLNKYISSKQDSLPLYFSSVLQTAGDLIFHDDKDGATACAAIEVLKTSVASLSTPQLKPFLPYLISCLKAMMSSATHVVRQDALLLLDLLLTSHPGVVYYFTKFLNYLLLMISRVQESNTKKGQTEKRMVIVCSSQTSTEWIMDVLQRMHKLLETMLKYRDVLEMTQEEDREVHWDGKQPLYLPLYLRGGPKPIPPNQRSLANSEDMDSIDLKRFIPNVVPFLSETLTGQIIFSTNQKSTDCNLFSQSTIEYVNIVAQVLYCIGEWIQKSSDYSEEKDAVIFKSVQSLICNRLMKGFPYAQQIAIDRRIKHVKYECLQLNLAVCHLYSAFILDTESADVNLENKVFTYLRDIFQVCPKMSCQSMAVTLKIFRNCLLSKSAAMVFKNGILFGVYGILDSHKISESAKLIYEFFMDISMDFDYKYLLNSEGMSNWHGLLLKELTFMAGANIVDKKFLLYVRQVCARKYAPFMESLNKEHPRKLIELLQYDDGEFQSTIIHLICSLDTISPEFLQDIAETLHDDTFSLKSAVRFIHQLTTRYSGPNVSEIDTINFVKFLLNLGCDSFSTLDLKEDTDATLTGTLAEVQYGLDYQIYPSSTLDRQLEFVEVCSTCLYSLPDSPIIEWAVARFLSYMFSHSKIHVHSAIALFKLRRKFDGLNLDSRLVSSFCSLMYSSLMYVSVLSQEVEEEQYPMYAIQALQNSLCLTVHDGCEMFQRLVENMYAEYCEIHLFHALRMAKFIIKKGIFVVDNANYVFKVMDEIKTVCQQSPMLNSYWVHICEYLRFL